MSTAPIQTARKDPSGAASPVRLCSFCVLTGAFCGVLTATVALSPEFLRNPVGTSSLSFGFGAFVGLMCSPVGVPFLRRREFHRAGWVVLGIVSPTVCVLAMFTPTLSLLMFLSGVAFCCAALTAWLVLPKVWDQEGVCRRCGYDLRGSLKTGRCPECATLFDDNEVGQAPQPQSEPRYRVQQLSNPVAAFGLLASLLFAGAMLVDAHFGQRAVPFDGAAWKQTAAVNRARMARDLVDSQGLIALTESEVVGRLGPADSRYDCDLYGLGGRANLIVAYDPHEIVQRATGSAFPQGIIDEDFETDLWANGTMEARLRMARSLFTNRSDFLMGKTRTEVRRILGTSDQRWLSISYIVGAGRAAPASSRQRLRRSLWMDTAPKRLVLTLEGGKVSMARLPVDSD